MLFRFAFSLFLSGALLCGRDVDLPKTSDTESFRQKYSEAWTLYNQGRGTEAIPALQRLLEERTFSYSAADILADLFDSQNLSSVGDAFFRNRTRAGHDRAVAWFGLGRLAMAHSKYLLGTQDFRNCLVEDRTATACYEGVVESYVLGSKSPVQKADIERLVRFDRRQPGCWLALGKYYVWAKQRDLAITACERGLSIVNPSHQPLLASRLEQVIGQAYAVVPADRLTAKQHWLRQHSLLESLGLPNEEFQSWLSIVGSLNDDVAIPLLTARLEQCRRQHLHSDAGNICWILGIRYRRAGKLDEAIRADQSAADEFEFTSRSARFFSLLRVSSALNAKGDSDGALRIDQSVFKESSRYPQSDASAFAAGSLGAIYSTRGDYFLALKYELLSVRLFQNLGKSSQAGASIGDVAQTYTALGDYKSALTYTRRSLAAASFHHDFGEQERNLGQIGFLCLKLQQPIQALTYFSQAVALNTKSNWPPYRPGWLLGEGMAFRAIQREGPALASLQESLAEAKRQNLRQDEIWALLEIGDVYRRSSRTRDALATFSLALASAKERQLDEAIASAELGMGRTLRDSGDDLGALNAFENAIASIEGRRQRVPTSDLRASFLSDNYRTFEEIVNLLCRLGRQNRSGHYEVEALRYAEMARAQTFLDSIVHRPSLQNGSLTPNELSQKSELVAQVSKRAATVERDPSNENQSALDDARRKLTEWNIQMSVRILGYADGAQAIPSDATDFLKAIQESTRRTSTALVEYFLGENCSYVWIVTANAIKMVVLPPRERLEPDVTRLRDSMLTHSGSAMSSAPLIALSRRVYRSLMAPALPYTARSKNLVIVPDGILYYLPFEALTDRNRYLIDDFLITYCPSAWSFSRLLKNAPLREPSMSKSSLLAYGDPVFREVSNAKSSTTSQLETLERGAYTDRGIAFARLPNTRLEVESISQFFAPSSRLIRLGEQATKEAFLAENHSVYGFLHFATHVVIDEQQPYLSGIVMSQHSQQDDIVLRTGDIANLTLDAELVVISACESGIGKFVRGEGIMGLTRAFFSAGSRRLVVSLWPVNDAITAPFMRTFYAGMHAGLLPSEALRAAKLQMLHSDIPVYQDPHFWGPFVLIGIP